MLSDSQAELIVLSARKYLGTPFHHQGRLPFVGLDCIGLGVLVAKDVGAVLEDEFGYSRIPIGDSLLKACKKNLDEAQGVKPGRIGIFRFKSNFEPQHLGIFTPLGMIHTYTRVRKVVEHGFDSYWQDRLHSVYEYRWQH